ncbi:MAG: CoA-acylating methylmalonate-semialdehyde dehydrogenase [Bacteroidetes bacterium]|nr:CoA-acylating methylmalonate-semialdehyde dehydrogenase [Bacteroidota bacterium]
MSTTSASPSALASGDGYDSDAPFLDVYSPASGAVIGHVPVASTADVDAAVARAKAALPAWSSLPIKERVQVIFRYRALLEQHIDELTALVTQENGKIESEARAEVLKSIELCEFAVSMPQITSNEVLEVSRGVECRIERHPVGVVASIAPFNFPNMVPNWTIPNAIVLGNTMVMKPSELVPLSVVRLAELLREAGLPDGVFNIVNGGREVVEALCDHPDIAAVSFVGSTKVAQIVYRRATANLKRALCMGGAKNHLIVLPDADREMAASNIVASMSGCAGQRCMAASVMVAVGPTDAIIQRMVEVAKNVVPGSTLGPVITAEAKARIERYITEAEAAGATVLLDGRGATVEGQDGGFWVGPTILDHVTPEMKIAQEEVFGPVLAIVRTPDVDGALAIENASPYGNAASVYTESGGMARLVAERASAGMIGVNVGVPVPREPFSFGGWNDSKYGVGEITGRGSIEFWTQAKKITTKWNQDAGTNWMS